MNTLFIDDLGKEYNANDIFKALKFIGADDCETLFIHSDVVFGNVPKDFNKKEYMQTLYSVLSELNVQIVVPTFTYSFCNHEDFDVRKSRTSVGALSEFIRKQDGRYRTLDPLLSLSVPETLKEMFSTVSEHSLGKGSGLDIIHSLDGVKFLFFGAKQGECFTYLHYIEKMLDVPYRYDQEFSGTVIDYDGNSTEKTQYIHTHCYGVKIPENYDYFEDELIQKGKVKKIRLGNSFVSCLSEKDAYEQITDKISKDPFYFVEGKYTEADLIHKYGFGENGERITHC